LSNNEDKQKNASGYVEMKLESGGGKIICSKRITVGAYKEEIKINSTVGRKQYFLS